MDIGEVLGSPVRMRGTRRLEGRRLAACALVLVVVACGSGSTSSRPGTSTATVAPAGGVVTSSDGVVTLTVPEGALSTSVTFTISTSSAAPSGAISGAYDINPEGTAFALPATLAFHYTPPELGSTSTDDLAISYASNGTWEPAGTTVVDTEKDSASTTITHLSAWALTRKHAKGDGGARDAGKDAPHDAKTHDAEHDAHVGCPVTCVVNSSFGICTPACGGECSGTGSSTSTCTSTCGGEAFAMACTESTAAVCSCSHCSTGAHPTCKSTKCGTPKLVSGSCTCDVKGVQTGTSPLTSGSEADVQDAWSACAFPAKFGKFTF